MAPRNLLFSRAFQVGVSQVIRRCSRFLFFFLAARRLGPEKLGLYALLLATVETLALISGEGFTDYLTREVSKTPELGRGLYVRVVELRLLYVVVLFIPAMAFLHTLKYRGEVLNDAFLLFLILFPRAPLSAGQGIIRAVGRFGWLVSLEVLQGAVLLGTGVFLLARTADLRSLIWAEVASAFAAGLASILLVYRFQRGKVALAV